MSTRFLTAILLAAGLAACKPVTSPQSLQALTPRQEARTKVDILRNPGSDVVSSLAALESKAQQEVIQIKAENLIIVNIDVENGNGEDERARDDDRAQGAEEGNARDKGKDNTDVARKDKEGAAAQQLMLEQVNQALVIDQQANAAKNEIDNILRAMALAHKEPEKSTVILVVQEIKVSIEIDVKAEDEKIEKRKLDASVYKQEAVIAKRGKQETQAVMVYDPRTLTAADAAANSRATPTEAANATKPAEAPAMKTVDAVLYNAGPTHTSVVEDPAASMRAALEAAVGGRAKEEERAQDVALNVEIAVEINVEIEKGNGRDDNNDDDNEKKEGEKERQREQKQEQKMREQKQAEQEKQKAEQKQQQARAQADANRKDEEDKEEKQAQDKKAENDRAASKKEQKESGDANDDAAIQQNGVKVTIVQ